MFLISLLKNCQKICIAARFCKGPAFQVRKEDIKKEKIQLSVHLLFIFLILQKNCDLQKRCNH